MSFRICPDCEGTGLVPYRGEDGWRYFSDEPCPTCEGSGEIEIDDNPPETLQTASPYELPNGGLIEQGILPPVPSYRDLQERSRERIMQELADQAQELNFPQTLQTEGEKICPKMSKLFYVAGIPIVRPEFHFLKMSDQSS